MNLDQALTDFNQICDRNVDFLRVLPAQLTQRGYAPAQRIRLSYEDGIEAVLYRHPAHGHGFSFVVDGDGAIWNAALILHDGVEERAAALAYVRAQPACREVTEEARPFAAWLPERIWPKAAAGRYWTSKQPGQIGRSFSLMPALFDLPPGAPGLALAVNRNLALQDPLTDGQRADLTGPGSTLQKFIGIYATVCVAHAPDGAAIAKAARACGYDGNSTDTTSFALDGGYGPAPRATDMTSNLRLNWQSPHAFECALFFRLDPRLGVSDIIGSLCETLDLPVPGPGGTATISLGDGSYDISLLVEDAFSGSYAFVIRKQPPGSRRGAVNI